jgi:hypothetical protein
MLQVVFDDTLVMPTPIRAAFGIDSFGSLVFRRRSWLEAMRALTHEAGWPPMIHLRNQTDVTALLERVRKVDDDVLYLICPSHLFPACGHESLETFLRQIEYSPTALYMFLQDERGRRGWALMRASLFRQFLAKQQDGDVDAFFEQHGETFVHVPDRLHLIDLSDEPILHEFLSGQFEARHFNALEREQYTVVKRSNDLDKLKREFEFYHLIPPIMQTYLIQPFDFQNDGKTASYRMERIGIPDMALQWVHGAFQEHEFKRFLAHIFHFIGVRPLRSVRKSESDAIRQTIYVEKVRTRITALKTLPAYAQLAPLLDRACYGIDALVDRYLEMYDRTRKSSSLGTLAIGHGDLCFSNIFYSKTNQYLKMIDPRGAVGENDLYTDPYYDLAKLSHSIQGAYDFVNHGKFGITITDDLRPQLTIEDKPSLWAAKLFRQQIEDNGFDPDLTRLYEASLFISMLPLHIDRPLKVLAFAIKASEILDTLSQKQVSP